MKCYRLFIITIITSFTIYAQNPPPDFKLVGTLGGAAPLIESSAITILSNGEVNFLRLDGGILQQVLLDTNFSISASQVQQIWQSVQNNNYFSLNTNYRDTTIQGGLFVLFTITANGASKQVIVKNIEQNEIQNIIASVNSNVPAEYNLNYTPPEKINIVPTEICSQPSNFSPNLLKEIYPNKYRKKIDSNYRFVSTADEIQIPHGGVEIGCEMSLNEAVASGNASLASKGEFFGDGVSITGNNIPQVPCNTLTLTLNLEFYGPCVNEEYVSRISNDIYNKWGELTTSTGKEIFMELVTKSHPGVSSPPGTPGYNNIKLDCNQQESYSDGLGAPNSDEVVGGIWNPLDPPGTFAQMAGNLMGFPHKLDHWVKTPQNEWINLQNGTILPNSEFMEDLYNSKWETNLQPGDFEDLKSLFIPSDGHENDLMANPFKSPLQSDIDHLAFLAGLIIRINAGDILIHPGFDQNLVVTHSGDLFLNPGEIKTLNGIYTACIDFHRGIPDSAAVFNIAPSLDKWDGIPAAKDLLKLVRYIDSTNYFCESHFQSQEAVWRITDNFSYSSSLFDTLFVDSIFVNAGINIGNHIFNFPRLKNNSGIDIISKAVVPNELFSPDIQPKIVLAEVGENLTYSAAISKPSGFNYTTDFSWLMDPPENSLSQISSSGSFVPDKKGIYTISVNINITDPASNVDEYTPELKAYAVVPDRFTETFENPNLLYRFEWETYGDSEWEVTNAEAQTGSYSVKSGEVYGGQSATLAINVNLQQDSLIAFAMKMFTYNSGRLFFDIDSNFAGYWTSSSDWQFYEYELEAGEHRLTWKFINYYNTPSSVWLDNIFFPANSVIAGIEDKKEVLSDFTLFQNYPNPFNPSTEIKYSLAEQSFVKLILFDVLGNKIKDLFIGEQNSGLHQVLVNASNLSSGIYFYSMEAYYGKGTFKDVKKMILLK